MLMPKCEYPQGCKIEPIVANLTNLQKKKARLLVWGSVLDDTAFIDMIESLDANVVIDDTCVGSRAYFSDVPVTSNPMDGLAQYYLADIKCPRTVKEADRGGKRKDYKADLEARFGYLKGYARDWNVNGVVLQSLRYCDGHGYEVPGLKDFFEDLGLPAIYLEHDYSVAALAPLRTRVQGLTEIIGWWNTNPSVSPPGHARGRLWERERGGDLRLKIYDL